MKTWIRVALFTVITFAFAYMIYIPYKEVKQQTTDKLNDKQMLIAKQAARSIENFFGEQIDHLRYLSDDPEIISMSVTGRNTISRSYANYSRYISAITRYDSGGQILYSYPNPEKVQGKSIAGQAHVDKLLKEHKPNVSDVFLSVQGYPTVAISQPVFEKGKFIGAIAFLVDFKYIAKTYLEVIKIGSDGYSWMISRDGVELYCPVPGHVGVNISRTSHKFPSVLDMADKMKQGLSGFAVYQYDMTKDKETRTIVKHAAYTPVHMLDNLWSIAVATPESEIYDELHSFYRKTLISVSVLLLALALLGYVMIKDFHLSKINKELEKRIQAEMEKRKKQEKFMLQQARFYSMGETLNAIAHQWRQPLNSIGMCIQDLEDAYKMGQLNDEYIQDTVKASMTSLNKLSDTIDDFRNFFTADEKKTRVNICGLLFGIHNIIRAQLDSLEIRLTFTLDGRTFSDQDECDPEKYSSETYPDMLRQVILNCLQNSKEAIKNRLTEKSIEKGEITIGLSKDRNGFVIEITDNGGGIHEDLLDKVFDPYFSTKDINIGMGLGLYMAKGIIEEQLNGSIKIMNFNDGAKTIIRF
ncbi:MAG: cache domain-containing protein [Deferribacterales bacterium]